MFTARTIPLGVVPSLRGQIRFTSACTRVCSVANHSLLDSRAR